MSYVDIFCDDMNLFHDAPADNLQPAGIPSWGSAAYPPDAYSKPPGWQYGIVWFHSMEDCPIELLNTRDRGLPWRYPGPYTGNQAPNTRLEIAHIQGWLLRTNGQWELWNYAQRPGAYMTPINWDEYSGGPYNEPSLRQETIGASILAPGRGLSEQHNWHSFTGALPIGEYLAIATCCYSRLILDNPAGTDDRASCRVLTGVAGDYYLDYATVVGNKYAGVNVEAMGYSRLKYVTNEWQLHGFYSKNIYNESQFRANPPPILATELIAGTGGGNTTNPNPQPGPDPGPPYQIPSIGNWFPITAGGGNNWQANTVSTSSSSTARRARRARMR